MSGTSDFYPRQRNLQFSSRGTTHFRQQMKRDNPYQFNNRKKNFGKNSVWQHASRWNEWNTWKPFVRNPREQEARSSFSAVNPRPQPFIPKFPVNLTVTIPNFSGVRRPDVFIFRNSSAKSVKFATSAPAGVFPPSSSLLPENKEVGASHLKSDENDEVQYLFTVQTKGDELVEVVDLSEDFEDPKASVHLPLNSIASTNVKECDNNRMIPKMHEKETVPSSDAAHRRGRKRKKSSRDLHCDICESEYELIRSRGDEIFNAKCGHMFCQQCLKKLDPYKCPECNIYLQKLFKIFL